MEARFLEYYNRELRYLRELGGEFARDFPKVAGRLGLDSFACADPYVERLLEGFAFLAARVNLKIDAEFPRFSEQLLGMLCPHYMGPTPSMAVVQLHPDREQGSLNDGFVVPRGTSLISHVRSGGSTACEYRTAHDVTLWPIELKSIAYDTDVSVFEDVPLPASRQARAALRIRLRTTNGLPFSHLGVDRLPLFMRGTDAVALRLFELLQCNSIAVALRDPGAAAAGVVRAGPVRSTGLSDEEALLPCGPRGFQGYRLLHEYFAFPQRFMFVELTGLAAGVRRCKSQEVEVLVALDRHQPSIEPVIAASYVTLYCSPAINLFPKKTDRIHLSHREFEYHVVPDRSRPLDFEVHSILDVTGFGTRGEGQRKFLPFYQSHDTAEHSENAAFFTVHRRERLASASQQARGPRSSYLGGEVFVALVDGTEGPYRSDLTQLGIGTLCTNRDLPLTMPVGEGETDFFLESGAPVKRATCVAGPSVPRPTNAWGETTWRLIGHLSLNYLSLTGGDDGRGSAALRELLQLYGDLTEPATRRQIEGVKSVSSRPIVRRLPFDGPLAFARGVELTVECDEGAFEGTSVALLGVVLESFLARYVSINSFTETVLKSVQRGEIARWAPRIGRRPTI
ncbi:MAG TPA: type VI secretion system baseplate subunit TssF [Polyangiaceae bacterium]|nr:type VI secretion system baseplate subunit TssF [Polyangiaceae bacterium]